MGLVLRQALIMAAKDTRLFFKDRFAVAFALLFPFLFVIGFSLALSDAGPEDKELQITVATLETQGISRQIIDALVESPDVSVQELPYEDALRGVENEGLNGFIAFPADFTSNLQSGNATSVEVVSIDGAPGERAALEGFARGISSRVSNSVTAIRAIIELQARESGGVPNIDPETLDLFDANPLVIFETEQVGDVEPFHASNFTLPGYLTMFVFFAAALAAESIARERETQTLERLMSNGVRRESIILGKYLGTSYRGLIQLALMWIVGLLAFRIDLGASPAAVILISVFMVLASAGFGVMLASLVKSQRSASSIGVLASLILAPIGGSWWPLFITPEWMQSLAKLTPHGWANTAFNNLMLFGAEFQDVITNMIALIGFAIAFIVIALVRFRLSAAS